MPKQSQEPKSTTEKTSVGASLRIVLGYAFVRAEAEGDLQHERN